jgi:Ca2+-transporting ATPase
MAIDNDIDFHATNSDDAVEKMDTSKEKGLSSEDVKERKEKYGDNNIEDAKRRSWISILVEQFQDYLVYILIIGAVLSLGVGVFPDQEPKFIETAIIMLIVIGNSLLGFRQEYQAEREIASLSELTAPDARVIRDGEKKDIDEKDVVPGDIVEVSKGDAVPADSRLIESNSLSTSESALTGESKQISKSFSSVVEDDAPVAERDNMIFKGTTVARGNGKAVVTDTGMDTEVGSIAKELKDAGTSKTPFQKEVDTLGRQLAYIITIFVVLLAAIQGLITGTDGITLILLAIGLVVAAIPEALPVIVTYSLAIGSSRLAEKDAVVRRLPVVESLGSVNYIVTDKTGTLTTGEMTVRKVYHDGQEASVTGVGMDTDGQFKNDEGKDITDKVRPVVKCGLYANDSEISEDGSIRGGPTESALLVSAKKADLTVEDDIYREVSFTSDRKRMSVITEEGVAYMKGAPDTVLERCDKIIKDGETVDMKQSDRERIQDKFSEYANEALRVISFAKKEVDNLDASDDDVEENMVFLGLQAMIDPPRDEVKDAVEDCRTAGVDVIMATGDDIETAKAVGKELGFNPENALTGDMIESMSTEELEDAVKNTEVFARVSPKHKVKVLKALQNQDYYVAMTGDGVNDAPALKNSDIGVAMGERGTDVAKQSSDLVLLDDNFVTIRDAIEEGRTIFDNIRKVTNYLLSTNSVEVMLIFLGAVVNAIFFPELFVGEEQAAVLSAVMILWVNFMTDGPPAIGIVFDESVPEVMDREPRDPDESIIDKKMISTVISTATIGSLVFLPVFFALSTGYLDDSLVRAQTVLFTILTLFELVMFHIIRREYELSILSNKWLLLGIIVAFATHLGVLYTPLSAFFNVIGLSISGWMFAIIPIVIFFLLSVAVQSQLQKYIGNRRD